MSAVIGPHALDLDHLRGECRICGRPPESAIHNSGSLLWRDFNKGDLVEVHADDYFDCSGEAAKKIKKHEYPFTIRGEIRAITQRTMWVIGYWKWQCPDEWCEEDDPQYSAGLFGVPRRGPERIYRLGYVLAGTGLPAVWIAPMPD